MTLTKAQEAILEDLVRTAGPIVYNGRARRSIEKLWALGLVKCQFTIRATDRRWAQRNQTTLTQAGLTVAQALGRSRR